jgi:beta-lactamase class A
VGEGARSWQGDLWFHAASTIKVPVLLGVYGAIHAGLLSEESPVHVRNRFFSLADGSRFRRGAGFPCSIRPRCVAMHPL